MDKLNDTNKREDPSGMNDVWHQVQNAPYGVTETNPTTSLEVIGAGFGRTGTLSLKVRQGASTTGSCYTVLPAAAVE